MALPLNMMYAQANYYVNVNVTKNDCSADR